MNEIRRTLTYVIFAGVLSLLAWFLSPPVEITPEELKAASLGKEFYPEFKNPNEATSIRVVGFDEAKAKHKSFGVMLQNGKWTIPSHHNYPADGADRLAKTAASVMHIKREELASNLEDDQEKLGVVDPLDESQSKLKGRGQRITLSNGENVLADYILGKAVNNRPGFYYIRKPSEKSTYVAKVGIDLSTKFADWVETDLLKLSRDDVSEIVIDHTSVDAVQGRLVEGEKDLLTREKSTEPWKLDGLDEKTEELEKSKIDPILGTLDDLKLAGVRPKPKGLRADLTFDHDFIRDPEDLRRLRLDLQLRGFFLVPDPKKKVFHLFSNAGELVAATNKGVVYTLRFGDVFSGDESEIEIGSSDEEKKKEDDDGDEKKKSTAGDSKQPSRYLFVTTHFDEKFLGPPPEAAEKPEGLSDEDAVESPPKINAGKKKATAKPAPKTEPNEEGTDEGASPKKPQVLKDDKKEGANDKEGPGDGRCDASAGVDDETKPSAAEKDKKPAKPATDDAAKGKDQPKDDSEDKPADKKDPAATDKKEDDAETPKEKPESAEKPKKTSAELKKEYESNLAKYKSDLKAYEEKIAAGKKQVEELNARFGDWYYVISAESFNKLYLLRKDLVKEKGKAAGDDSPTDKKPDSPPEKDPFAPENEKEGDEDPQPSDKTDKKAASDQPPADKKKPAKKDER